MKLAVSKLKLEVCGVLKVLAGVRFSFTCNKKHLGYFTPPPPTLRFSYWFIISMGSCFVDLLLII